MTIYTDGMLAPVDLTTHDVPLTTGEYIGESGVAALADSPTAQIWRLGQLAGAGATHEPIELTNEFGSKVTLPAQAAPAQVPIEEARARVKSAGLERQMDHLGDAPIAAPVLDLMMQNATTRRKREANLARAPQGYGPWAAAGTTGFLASAVDPLNVGAAFIPVVGEARAARWLASAGEGAMARARMRAGIGALQGGAGMVPLEGLTWLEHSEEGQDYGKADLMRGLLFGSVFGAILHAGGGALGDWLTRGGRKPGEPIRPPADVMAQLADLPPEAQEQAARATLGALHDGSPVRTGEMLNAAAGLDPRIAESVGAPKGAAVSLDDSYRDLAATPDHSSAEALQASQRAGALPEPGSVADAQVPLRRTPRAGANETYEPSTGPDPEALRAQQTAASGHQAAAIEADRQAIHNDMREQLVAAGRPAEEAEHVAGAAAQRYVTRAARLGGGALDLYEREKLQVRNGEGHEPRRNPTRLAGQARQDQAAAAQAGRGAAADAGGGRGFVDTRGSGAQFHGTSAPELEPSEDHYSTLNYYGQGFYTTDAVDIAHGYSKRGAAKTGERNLFQVEERRPLKILDGEKPLPDEVDTLLRPKPGEKIGELQGLLLDALDEKPATVRELYDAIRENGSGEGLSADVIQEVFDSLNWALGEAGYGGMSHTGGLKTGKQPHRVVIYFHPEKDIQVHKAEFATFENPAENGAVTFTDQRKIIDLFKSANASTALHEFGHIWLEELLTDAAHPEAPMELRHDRDVVLGWLGAKEGEPLTTEQHEQWARGFEQYLRDGKAPSTALAKAFEAFKGWLKEIYRSVTKLGVPISDDIRGVMDRLIATDEEIADKRSIDQTKHVTARPRQVDESKLSLMQFLAHRGGVKPTADLHGLFDGKDNVPFIGKVLRETGMTEDRAREAAVEAGYIQDNPDRDGGGDTRIRDLHNAISEELRGRKQYRAGHEPEAAGIDRDEERARVEAHVDSAFESEGIPRPEGPLYDRVVEMVRDGVNDPLDAFERATMEEHYAGRTDGQERPVVAPGAAQRALSDDAARAPGDRGSAADGGAGRREIADAGEGARRPGGSDRAAAGGGRDGAGPGGAGERQQQRVAPRSKATQAALDAERDGAADFEARMSVATDKDPQVTLGYNADGTPRRMRLSEALAQIEAEEGKTKSMLEKGAGCLAARAGVR